jgi:hypothetical protein
VRIQIRFTLTFTRFTLTGTQVDFMFFLSCFARFFTVSQTRDGVRIATLDSIFSNYFGYEFLYDLAAAMPWGAITTVPVFDFVKLLRFKYLWVSLFPPFFRQAFAILRAFIVVFGAVHLVAVGCCIVIVIDGSDSDSFLPEMSAAPLLQDAGLRYVAALYWALNALVNNNYAHPHTKLQLT